MVCFAILHLDQTEYMHPVSCTKYIQSIARLVGSAQASVESVRAGVHLNPIGTVVGSIRSTVGVHVL